MKFLKHGVVALALAAAAPAALAGTTTSFTFACYTNNTGSCGSYASQLQLDITALAGNQVEFRFMNQVNPATGFITNIWFDLNTSQVTRLVNPVIPAGQVGVGYTLVNAPNGSPPGSGSGWPNSASDFLARANAPGPTNGVNPGEQLIVTGLLNVSYADLIASFAGPDTASRIGLHYQGIALPGITTRTFSEGMYAIAMPDATVVPVPAALPLMLSGLVGLGLLARRRCRAA